MQISPYHWQVLFLKCITELHPLILGTQYDQKFCQVHIFHIILQKFFILMRKEKEGFYQQADSFAFIRNTVQSLDIFLWRTFFQQADFTLSLNGRQRIIKFMGSTAYERFFGLESRVYAVEHTIDRSDQIVQFVMVTGCLNPDIQIIPPDAPQLFQNTLHRCQHSIGIKPSNEINRYGTENEQKKYQDKHMILYLRSIVVPGKYQNYKITFIIRVIQCRTHLFFITE